MPVQVSYPGVYIQEVPSGSRAIAGVPTSVAAFLGYTARGPVNAPVQLFSFADFERAFGGLHADSPASYAVNHFFLNGGASAWMVRVAQNAQAANVMLQTPGGADTLLVEAVAEGAWGNRVVLGVDFATSSPASTFNLTVTELREQNGRLVVARTETHRNLSMNTDSANYAPMAVNADSDMVRLTDQGAAGSAAVATGGLITDAAVAALGDATRRLAVAIDAAPPIEFDLFDAGQGGGAVVATLQDVADVINGGGLAPGITMSVVAGPVAGEGRLRATTDSSGRTSAVSFRQASVNSATAALRLNLISGAREAEGSAALRPAQTGTAGGRIADFNPAAISDGDQIEVRLNDAADTQIDNATVVTFSPPPASLAEARGTIETALRTSTIPAIAQARVSVIDGALVVVPGGETRSRNFSFAAGGAGDAAGPLNLTAANGATVNVAGYELGVGPASHAQGAVQAGDDGTPPPPALIAGSRAAKTGIYALEDVDIFNILVPGVSDVPVLTEAIAYAEERRAMVLIDPDAAVNTLDEARDWINDPANSGLKHRNAAAYFPRVRLADPLQNNRLRSFPASGLIAGLWARTDAQRGIWKAPAGIEARLRGVQALDYVLSDPENGVLNPLGLNAIRTFPVFGTVAWGARTLVGADAFASEWKYVPVRRIALYIEESLYRGTQFVVFEPNDEPLWAQIRLAVGSFMNRLFRQGAFQGATPQEAYFVRCDSSTTTQADIDLGIVNIHVGFAPLKPAEFVIIHIQQIAGQSQA